MFPELAALHARLNTRFATAEERVAYLRTATDLQVTKASGLLAFTAIICALATFLYDKLDPSAWAQSFCIASGLVALLASAFTLRSLWSSAPTAAQFSSAESEADWLTSLLFTRALLINRAVALSAAAAAFIFVGFAIRALPESSYLPRAPAATGPAPARHLACEAPQVYAPRRMSLCKSSTKPPRLAVRPGPGLEPRCCGSAPT